MMGTGARAARVLWKMGSANAKEVGATGESRHELKNERSFVCLCE